MRRVRDPRDFCSGVLFLATGLAAVAFIREHSMGTATRMGPAYFPTVLGALLAAIGLAIVVRALIVPGDRMPRFAVAKVALVTGANVLFALLVRGAGLAVALVVLVVVSGYASRRFAWGPALALAVALSVFSVLVFVKALGLPMPIVGTWLGG